MKAPKSTFLRLTLYVLLVSSLVAAPAASAPPDEVKERHRSRTVSLRCPESDGICSWSIDHGWKPLYSAPAGHTIRSFWQSSIGGAVALLRGHQDEGMVVVIAEDGRVLASRYLTMSLGLETVSTEAPNGDVVLCNATREQEACDVHVLLGEVSSPNVWSQILPTNCLLLRFTVDGAATCFRRTDGGVTYRVIDAEGRYTDAPFPKPWLPDDVLHLGSTFLLQKGDELYYWDGQTLEREELGGVRWMENGLDTAFVATCSQSDHGDVQGCQIEVLDPELGRRTIWHSSALTPVAVRQLTAELVIVDAWNEGDRELIQVSISEPSPWQTTVWSRRRSRQTRRPADEAPAGPYADSTTKSCASTRTPAAPGA